MSFCATLGSRDNSCSWKVAGEIRNEQNHIGKVQALYNSGDNKHKKTYSVVVLMAWREYVNYEELENIISTMKRCILS